MKKIMFNDRYGLTQAVIEGRKTMTRRIVGDKLWDRWTDYDDFCNSVSCGPSTPVVRQYYNEFEFFKDNVRPRLISNTNLSLLIPPPLASTQG